MLKELKECVMWLAGIDEAGRGCLCGSLFISGVVGRDSIISSFGAKDSKQLSPKKREEIYQRLHNASNQGEIGIFLAQIDAKEIDTNGLSWAMRYGIESLVTQMGEFAYKVLQDKQKILQIIIDGNSTFNAQIPQHLIKQGVSMKTLIKADSLIEVVSCASIVAKVHKDRQMRELDKLYPQYALAKNKGYGTLEHRKSILKYGYCPHHRKSFKIAL